MNPKEKLVLAALDYIGEKPIKLIHQREKEINETGFSIIGVTADPKWLRLVESAYEYKKTAP